MYRVAVAPDHTDTDTLGKTPLDKGSARRRDLYLTTHNTHKRQTSMPPAGFEHAIPARQWSQNHALDRAVTGINQILSLRVVRRASVFIPAVRVL